MIGELGRRSSLALLIHSALIQAVTFLVRPATSYRALELDVPGFALGLLAASYAVFPLLLALPIGGLVDRLGERRLMAIGSAVVLGCSAFLLLFGTSVPALVAGTALLGAGQLACVVGQQAVVANNANSTRLDSAFGYLTFAASLGQALGAVGDFLGGRRLCPPGYERDLPSRDGHGPGAVPDHVRYLWPSQWPEGQGQNSGQPQRRCHLLVENAGRGPGIGNECNRPGSGGSYGGLPACAWR
nr:MFS transporter [Arthrobacter sp. StoSoilB13]